jgi:hypothetical protein
MSKTQDGASDSNMGAARQALWGDVPAILDSIWRRVEFYMYRPGWYEIDKARPLGETPDYRLRDQANTLAFYLYALLSVFIVTGPTIDTFCGLGGESGLKAVKVAVAIASLCFASVVYVRFRRAIKGRLRWRLALDAESAKSETEQSKLVTRERLARFAFYLISVFAVLPFIVLILGLGSSSDVTEQCSGVTGWAPSVLWQSALIVLVPVAGAAILRRLRGTGVAPNRFRLASVWCLLGLAVVWLVAVVSLIVWAIRNDGSEAVAGPYLHTTWIVLGTLLLILFVARWLVTHRLTGLPTAGVSNFKRRIQQCSLLNVHEDDGPPPPGRGLSAFVTGVGLRPLQVLLLPAMFAITVPRAYVWAVVAGALVISAFASTYGSLRERWHQVVSGIERWFFVGLPLPVSCLVILLGILRLMDEQYVSTVLEAAPIGTIFTGIVFAYLVVWFFEVWVNRWLAEEVLRGVGASDEEAARGSMEIVGNGSVDAGWTLGSKARLYIHGPGRIGVEGWQERALADGRVERVERFANYTFVELYRALATTSDSDRAFMDELQRQVRMYFYSVNALVLFAGLALLYGHTWASEPQKVRAVISAAVPSKDGVNLAQRLTNSNQPAFIVAASGGGTRAALYTVHALQGLQNIGQAKNVVLISGVSGGGAAAAGFVSRFDQLIGEASADVSNKDSQWGQYKNDLTAPFISDVLDGMDELRIAGPIAMGQLLAESMDRRVFKQATMGSITADAPALILNSTISGHPVTPAQLLDGRAAWKDGSRSSCAASGRPFGSLAGGRLVYTNLPWTSFKLPNVDDAPDVRLDFGVVNDPATSLASAAALNANFPPVFPNARVDLAQAADACNLRMGAYFVTDGGATENLGLISALVALRNTLAGLTAEDWGQLRPIHLVAIEASAVDYEYAQDRGIGAATGGSKERIAGGFTQLLLSEINKKLVHHGKSEVKVHFLPLPLAFRSRGGFGTHWMYAKTIKVSNPLLVEMPPWYRKWQCWFNSSCVVTLHQDDIAALWAGLFRSQGRFCDGELVLEDRKTQAPKDALTVQNWVCGEQVRAGTKTNESNGTQVNLDKVDWQVQAWQALLKDLAVQAN